MQGPFAYVVEALQIVDQSSFIVHAKKQENDNGIKGKHLTSIKPYSMIDKV